MNLQPPNAMPKYDAEYFIEKFEAIPEEKWRSDGFYGSSDSETFCAMGHCGVRDDGEWPGGDADALIDLFLANTIAVVEINDGGDQNFPQPTPKQRILAALLQIQAQTKSEKE